MARKALLRRASDNGKLGKITAIADIVNRLGVATTIIAVGLGLIVAVAFGKIENPWASATQLQRHDEQATKATQDVIGVHQRGVALQERATLVLEKLNCKMERSPDARQVCFEDIGK